MEIVEKESISTFLFKILENTTNSLIEKIDKEWPQKQFLWDKILDSETFVWTENVTICLKIKLA